MKRSTAVLPLACLLLASACRESGKDSWPNASAPPDAQPRSWPAQPAISASPPLARAPGTGTGTGTGSEPGLPESDAPVPSVVPPPLKERVSEGLELVLTDRVLALDQAPPEGSRRIAGSVSVLRDGVAEPGAAVTLNGQPLAPEPGYPGRFVVPDEAFDGGLQPGTLLDLHASHQTDSARLRLSCPGDVRLTNPPEGSAARPRQRLNVRWTGLIAPPDSREPATLSIQGLEQENAVALANGLVLKGYEQAAMVTVPAADPAGYLVTLKSCGRAVETSTGPASCCLLKRAHLRTHR